MENKKIRTITIYFFDVLRWFSVLYYIYHLSEKFFTKNDLWFFLSIIGIMLVIVSIYMTKSVYAIIFIESIKYYCIMFLLDVIFNREYRLLEFNDLSRILLNIVFFLICIYLSIKENDYIKKIK